MKKSRRKRNQGKKDGFIERIFAKTKIPAHVTEEQDWYLDTPDVRLTRVFTIVLVLHVVAVGGILAFKMIEKAAAPATTLADSTNNAAVTPVPEPSGKASAPVSTPVPAAPVAEEKPMPELLGKKSDKPLVMDHPSADGHLEYRAVAGDTVLSVARKMKVDEAELRELNQLGSRDTLPSGEWLLVPKESVASASKPEPESEVAKTVPPKPAVKTEKTPEESAKAIARIGKPAEPKAEDKSPVKKPAAENTKSYKVQKGDTPYGIARRFGVGLKDLMAANGIEKPENLRAGQTVVIPKG